LPPIPNVWARRFGFLAVLHTWGQNLHLHPHLHCVVPVGGVGPDGARWVGCRKKSFFLPVQVLGCRFRNVFLTYLKEAYREGKLRFHGEMAGLAKPAAFEAMCRKAGKIKWVVHVKPPFGGPEQVLKYLARYTHRVAISNSRILSVADGKVTFLWKDYADGNKTMTLDAVEFIRRFCSTFCLRDSCASASLVFWRTERGGRNWRFAARCSARQRRYRPTPLSPRSETEKRMRSDVPCARPAT
jgi:hypothetical protein